MKNKIVAGITNVLAACAILVVTGLVVWGTFWMDAYTDKRVEDQYRAIILSGAVAARSGVPATANPHQYISARDSNLWLQGWIEGKGGVK